LESGRASGTKKAKSKGLFPMFPLPENAEQTWLQNSSQVDVRLNISFKHSLMLESITWIYPL
jgi:hypothetical protein